MLDISQDDRKIISGQRFDEERALYNLQHAVVSECDFAGPADGESVLKEAGGVALEHCSFSLRYPLWHTRDFTLRHSSMDEKTRAAIWYAERGEITDCELQGIKAVRECGDIALARCAISSPEFGWKSRGITMSECEIDSEYLFFDSRDVQLERVSMRGKYSFQYMQNLTITDCELDTKDAFWHSKNVTVHNSLVRGEYLGWFSDSLTLINCKIIGTQPLCYCNGLRLLNCEMEQTDLSFEYSEVDAQIVGHIESVKNPRAGVITADSVGEIIREAPVMDCHGRVVLRGEGA